MRTLTVAIWAAGGKGSFFMIDEAKTNASCALINRHGEVVTWQARGDGICYVSDAPPSLDWIGDALAVCLLIIGILLVLRAIRWIGSKFWKWLRVSQDQRSLNHSSVGFPENPSIIR
jgi:hypothetical protein